MINGHNLVESGFIIGFSKPVLSLRLLFLIDFRNYRHHHEVFKSNSSGRKDPLVIDRHRVQGMLEGKF